MAAPAHEISKHKVHRAHIGRLDKRVRIEAGYMSQLRGKSRVRESGNSDSQRGRQGQPFRLISWIGPGRWDCPGYASPRKTGAPLTTPPARPKQTEIRGMAGTEFGREKKNNFVFKQTAFSQQVSHLPTAVGPRPHT